LKPSPKFNNAGRRAIFAARRGAAGFQISSGTAARQLQSQAGTRAILDAALASALSRRQEPLRRSGLAERGRRKCPSRVCADAALEHDEFTPQTCSAIVTRNTVRFAARVRRNAAIWCHRGRRN
jgi:hypothetical protein